VVEAALDAIVTIDADGEVVQWNARAEQVFQYERAAALGRPVADLVIPPELRDAHWSGLRRVVAGGESRILDRTIELTAMRRGGERFPVELTVTRSGAEPPRFTAFVRDLSELRHAEDRGARMRTLLAEAERLAGIGSWDLDLRTGEGMWSDEAFRLRGLEPGEVVPDVDLVLALVHPEDRERVSQVLALVAEDPESVPADGLTLDYRIQRTDGEVREVRAHGRVERDADGEPARWVGFVQDMTEERLTERELQAHYAVSQALRDWESFEEGVVGLLRRLGTALDYGAAALWLWDEAGQRLVCRAFWSVPGVDTFELDEIVRETTFRPGEGVPGRVWSTGQPHMAPDVVEELVGERRTAAQRLGLGAGVAFAATSDDGPLAVLTFYAFDRRPRSERLLRTVTGIGRELGRFLARRRAELGPRPLSAREMEVLRLAADGNTGPQIAELLVVAPATVKTHFEHIYEKLGVSDRPAAVALALRTGLIQ
jgi:PAS domain S-box-containing protein